MEESQHGPFVTVIGVEDRVEIVSRFAMHQVAKRSRLNTTFRRLDRILPDATQHQERRGRLAKIVDWLQNNLTNCGQYGRRDTFHMRRHK